MKVLSIFLTLFLFLILTSCDDGSSGPAKGTEGGACYEDKSCLRGLVCDENNICIKDISSPDKDINSDEDTGTDIDILVDEDITPDEDEIIDEDIETDTDILVDEDITPDEDEIIDEDIETDTDILVDEDITPDEDEIIDEDIETDTDILVDEDITPDEDEIIDEDIETDTDILVDEDITPDEDEIIDEDIETDTDILVDEDITPDEDEIIDEDIETDTDILVDEDITPDEDEIIDEDIIVLSDDATLAGLSTSGIVLSPSFSSDVYVYSGTTSLTATDITATTTDPNATITINAINVNSGQPYSLPIISDYTQAEIIVTAEDSITKKYYYVNISKLSDNADLSNIYIYSYLIQNLSPSFNKNTLNYTVTTNIDSIEIAPVADDSESNLLINELAYDPSTTKTISLVNGTNTINIAVTAKDGISTKTYTLTVTRLKTESKVTSLTTSEGTLDPLFNPNTFSYDLDISDAASIDITANLADTSATVTIDDISVIPGIAATVNIVSSYQTITIIVTAEDNITTSTYYINVTSHSANAYISSLTVAGASISPAFDKNTLAYSVTTHTSSIEVEVTAEDSNAIIQSSLLGNSVGSLTNTVYMNSGEHTQEISITVKATDNTTEKTYTLIYNYTNTAPSISDLTISGTPYLNETLYAEYTFSDIDGDNEGTTTYSWYRCTAVDECQLISGQNSSTYQTTSSDVDNFIKVLVIPKDNAFNSLEGTYSEYMTTEKIRPFYSYMEETGGTITLTFSSFSNNFLFSGIFSDNSIVTAHTDLTDITSNPTMVSETFSIPQSSSIANIIHTAGIGIFTYSDGSATKATSWTVGDPTTTALPDPSASSSDNIWFVGGGTDSTYIIMKQGNNFIIRTWDGTIWSDYTSENVAATDGDFGSLNNKPFAVYTDGTNTNAVTFEPVMTNFASQPSNDLLSNISIAVIGSDIYAAGLNSSGNIKVLKYSSGLWSSVFLSTTAGSDVKIAASSNKLFLIYIAADETLQYMEYNLSSWSSPVKAGNTTTGENIDIEANDLGKVIISYFNYDINGTHIIVK